MQAVILKCSFVLLALCHPPKTSTGLFLLNASLSSADVQTTFSAKSRIGRTFYEKNPVTRPLMLSVPKAANVSLAIGGDVLLADLGLRMRRSDRWYRHVWWLPQLAVAGANAWGVNNNLALSRAHSRAQ